MTKISPFCVGRLAHKPPYPAGVIDYRISGDHAGSPLLGTM
ncbi:MAG: hypothetical protein ACI4JG_00120 [Acutalibacteraceae bacterium]